LFKLLLVITSGNETATADLHQEVMIKAARKMQLFDSEEKLWAWLSQIARNTWIDHLRRIKTQIARQDADEPSALTSPAAESSLLEYLELDLTRLSAEERLLVEVFYYQEESQKTIAERLGRTVKSIECELARVRQKLKKFIIQRLNEKR
jgi:RNA polymerase sigma-70 factor (ECF subfamily)